MQKLETFMKEQVIWKSSINLTVKMQKDATIATTQFVKLLLVQIVHHQLYH